MTKTAEVLLGSLLFVAQLASAQARPGATVSGAVWDSLAHAPLGGARVQLVAADSVASFSHTTTSDSLGRFAFGGVADGRYLVGFLHPMLDSLGIEPPAREVRVVSQQSARVELAIPSAGRLQAAYCPSHAAPDTTSRAVIVGVVREAPNRATVGGASVSASWLDLAFSRTTISSHTQRLAARTANNGWFAICNAPPDGTVFLVAERAADRTDTIEVVISAEGFLRRDLYVAPPGRFGAVSGSVVTIADGRPIGGAEVGIVGGPRTRTNDRGEWTLADAPAGTRMLEIRAVGYTADRRPVDVIEGGPTVRTALATTSALLDTVNVRGTRRQPATGFEERRRIGQGYYVTADEVRRRNPWATSDLFRVMPGVQLDPLRRDSMSILVRSALGDSFCHPTFYVNGAVIPGMSADELDSWANPDEIVGIEVYVGATAPAQFQREMTGCGSILVWTKPKTYAKHASAWMAAASLGVLVGLGLLFDRALARH